MKALKERLAALPLREAMVVDTSEVGGGRGTTAADKVFYRAFSKNAWLAWVSSFFTERGDNFTGYLVGPYAGTVSTAKPWGTSMTRRAEGANIAAADPGFVTFLLTSHKSGFDYLVSNESLADVDHLEQALAYGGGYTVGLDAALQLVNGDGSDEATGLRTTLARAEHAGRAVVTGANAPTLDQMEELVYSKVPAKARAMSSCAFLTSDENLRALAKSTRGSPTATRRWSARPAAPRSEPRPNCSTGRSSRRRGSRTSPPRRRRPCSSARWRR